MDGEIFGRAQGKSFVQTQPIDEASWLSAQRAAVSCPVGSIKSEVGRPEARTARDGFPLVIDSAKLPNVYFCGFTSSKSFGAKPYLLAYDGLTAMVDSPRYSSLLALAIEANFGAPDYMLLTHVDDVADHAKWKQRFPNMRRVIHKAEVRGPESWPYTDLRDCEMILEDDAQLDDHLYALHVPGHSRGHLAFVADGVATGGEPVVFSGDHLAYSARLDRLDGFARYGWDVGMQADSIERLADVDFLHILPGHGRAVSFESAADRQEAITAAADVFRRDPYGRS